MYHAFIRHQIRKSFASLGKGSDSSGDNLARDVEHVFAGDSAIGGTRHGPEAFKRWLSRVYRLLPDLSFEVQDILVSGGPLNTRVAFYWRSRAITVTGDPYVNDGVLLIRLSKGKITNIRVLTDTVVIAHDGGYRGKGCGRGGNAAADNPVCKRCTLAKPLDTDCRAEMSWRRSLAPRGRRIAERRHGTWKLPISTAS